MKRSNIRRPILGIVLFVLYFATATLGLRIQAVSGFATLVWIPSGLSLAFLFIFGLRYWPAVTLAAFVANHYTGAPILAAAGIGIGNTLEPLVGAYLLKRFVKLEPELNRVNHVLGLILFATFFSTLISATVGVTSLWLDGVIKLSNYGSTWRAWYAGDAISDMIIAPLILTWSRRPVLSLNRQRLLELTAFFGFLLLVVYFVFGTAGFSFFTNQPRGYLIFPLMVLAAIRYGQRVVVAALFLISIISIWYTAHGHGLSESSNLSNNLLNLQTYMVVVAATSMILAAAISERKMFERKKDEFISVASHELKTPLTSIKAFTQALQFSFERKGDKQSSNLLSRTNRQVDRLNNLVSKLLDLTRIQEGRVTLQKERFGLDKLINEIVEEISVTSNRKILIQGDRRARVVADRDRIGRVLTNLLTNADKYSPEADQIILRVTKRPSHLTISVKDFGPGIADQDRDRIFDRFYQTDNHTSSKHNDGLGLGLYIAKNIVEQHGGKIWVKSQAASKPGKSGSTFYFTLPTTATKG